VSALDQKPKSTDIRNLKRIKNIISNPQVALLIDRYDHDWQKLWYILISGTATVVEKGSLQKKAVELLVDKYPQYQDMHISENPVIQIIPTKITSWGI
jgi:PPOX class probable F420-dependent enzyme